MGKPDRKRAIADALKELINIPYKAECITVKTIADQAKVHRNTVYLILGRIPLPL